MKEIIKDFVRVTASVLPLQEPIYEFGSLQVAGQEGFADLRPFFPGKQYVGCDMRPGPGVDRILDLHNIDLPDSTAGTVLDSVFYLCRGNSCRIKHFLTSETGSKRISKPTAQRKVPQENMIKKLRTLSEFSRIKKRRSRFSNWEKLRNGRKEQPSGGILFSCSNTSISQAALRLSQSID